MLELKDVTLELLKDLKSMWGIVIRYFHCDNAGENKSFEWLCKQEGLSIKFEYAMPSTPQQNGKIEQELVALYNRVQDILNGGIFLFVNYGL